MIRKLFLVLTVLFILCGCKPVNGNKDIKNSDFSLACGKNISLNPIIRSSDVRISILDDADLKNQFRDREYDFIIADLQTGMDAFKDNGNYLLYAGITFPDYYLTSIGKKTVSGPLGYCGENMGLLCSYLAEKDLKEYELISYENEEKLVQALMDGSLSSAVLSVSSHHEFIKEAEMNNVDYMDQKELQSVFEISSLQKGIPDLCLFIRNDLIGKDINGVISVVSKLSLRYGDYEASSLEEDASHYGFDSVDDLKESIDEYHLQFECTFNQMEKYLLLMDIFSLENENFLVH